MHQHLLPSKIEMRGHKIEWGPQVIRSVFGQKDRFDFRCMRLADTPRGNRTGHYIISHGPGPTGMVDWDKKIQTRRPAQRLSVAIITRNNDTDLAKCLNSVQWVADQIVVVDNGSQDNTLQIAESYGAEIYHSDAVWPVALENGVHTPPGSFAWLRNQSLEKCNGDWVLWIDSDEELKQSHLLHPYLASTIYDGFVVRQHHLVLDAKGAKDHDKPVRLFRNHGDFEFYGCIHEHAQPSINQPIEPALELPDTCIAHYGYTMEADRQAKCKDRNLQLLALDRKLFPERRLGLLLLQRDYLNILKWDAQEHKGLTDNGQRAANSIYEIFEQEFSDPKDRYYSLSMDILQEMMSITQQGMSYDIIVQPNPEGGQLRFNQPAQLENYVFKQATNLVAASFAESADLVHFEGL
jgi:glycosyltransferase involved in cell wall biosynthesis